MTRLQNPTTLTVPGSERGSTPAPRITQAELEHYRELAALEQEKKALRKNFLDRLAAGATVETGHLVLSVRTLEMRRITQTSLRGILPQEAIDWIKTQIEPTTCMFLTVKENQEDVLEYDGRI